MQSVEIKVTKRNGDVVNYDYNKIRVAIKKAMESTGDQDEYRVDELGGAVSDKILNGNKLDYSVEEIQDIVEDILISYGESQIAKNYIIYRDTHNKIRDSKKLMIDIDKTIGSYMDRSDWRVNENASTQWSLGGLIMHNSGTVTANYWLNNIYPKAIADAHRSCAFHIHDLSMLSPYCSGNNLLKLIKEGFGGVPNKIDCAPAKHLNTIITQMVNFLGCMSLEFAGAQAFSDVDLYLAPYVKADNMTYDEVYDCIQSYMFSINVASRWGSQAPFTNHSYDIVVPKDMKLKKAWVGGVEMDFTYGDCQKEMDMINKAFLEVNLKGDAKGNMFQYPIPTYSIGKDFNWDNPNVELLFKLASKYGSPYFTNYVNSDLNPEESRSMCFTGDTIINIRDKNGYSEELPISTVFDKYPEGSYDVMTPDGYCQVVRSITLEYNDNIISFTASRYDKLTHKTKTYNLKVTKDHPSITYVNGKEVVTISSDLKIGDKIMIRDTGLATINSIVKYPVNTKVYDLEVSGWDPHTFYANNILTHNCCRLRLDLRELIHRGGGLFGASSETGSVGVVTINLPQLAFIANGDKDKFFNRFGYLIELANESLTIKRKVVEQLMSEGFYPYAKRYLGNLDTYFNTIGINGAHEACLNFFKDGSGIDSEKGRNFALDIMKYLNAKISDLQSRNSKILINSEASPAESTATRFALHDRINFPGIIQSGPESAPYYTNSTQLPVDYGTDIFEVLDHQDDLQSKYTGGTVIHIHLGEEVTDWTSSRELVKTIFNKYRSPYITLSPIFSICPIHGYLKGKVEHCPKCKEEKTRDMSIKLRSLVNELSETLING